MPNEFPAVIPLARPASPDQGDGATPDPPDWLTDKGREAWETLAPLYRLTPRDLAEFAAFCEAFGEFHEATEMISDVGLVVIDPASGMPTPNPLAAIRDRADAKLARWATRFERC
ncbi:P27 family phage terminase small subunit [Gordonia bronchialis]|uniref:P27 family phage terminase small subunit n=1 Tax=Gordonia bronchialis TaxID=2054 RepID=UPI001CBDBA5C|nr:P27 family phage terminase small subunit [Gordonia bronchialis]UAK38430.1 P27 family phage terminase small subunit [Gordonia bronchialis]